MLAAHTYFAHQHGRIVRALVVAEQSRACASASRRGTTAAFAARADGDVGSRRASFTLMASVADDPAIQRLLPHIILANKSVLTYAVVNGICEEAT